MVVSTTYEGVVADVVVDVNGAFLRHVVEREDGEFWFMSKLTGDEHYVV
jgi:hypothetical protein